MRHLATLALTLASVYAASLSSSQCSSPANAIDLQEHLLEACQPINSTGHRDLTTPCGVEASIQMQCIYNASPEKAVLPDYEFPFRHTPLVSNETLRDCLCQSYIFDVMKGCSACNRANGGLSGFGWEEEESYDKVRSSYCAASATPTQNFADFMHSALATAAPSSGSTECNSVPLSSGTVTNIPYTPTVPLKEANNVTLPSPTETGKNATSYTSLMTSDGQIVPSSDGKGGSHRNKKGHDKDSSAAGAISRAGVAVGSLGAAAIAIAAVVL